MYELKSVSNQNNGLILEESAAKKIICDITYLGKNMHTYLFYQIVKRNFLDLLVFINNAQESLEKSDTLECNRLLFNFVDTFYSYINFFEANYKDEFKPIKNDLHAKHFEYAFIYALRNYMVHEDMPILKYTREVAENYIKNSFIISKKHLLSSTRLTSKNKKLLSDFFAKDEIDILPILVGVKPIIVNLQAQMLSVLSESLIDSFKNLKKYVVNEQGIFLIKDGKIVNGLLNVLSKYYKCIADNFIYEENLLSNPSIKKIYLEFSFVYYGKDNVIYVPE